MFSSAQKDTHVTELHARIPLTVLRRHMVIIILQNKTENKCWSYEGINMWCFTERMLTA